MRLRGYCTRVVDGDTYDILLEGALPHNLNTERVRLEGLDTPEVYGPYRDPERGEMASQFAADRILGKPVVVELDRKRMTLGRVVGEVFFREAGVWRSLANALRAAGHEK